MNETHSAIPIVRTLPLQTRLMPVASVDEKTRKFQVVWTAGAQVRRFDWMTGQYYLEELVVEPAAVDMSRFDAGMPVLNSHQQWDLSSVLGVVERGWLDGGQGLADCRFSDRDEEVNGYWRDVANGIIRNVSVGYIVNRYQKTDAPPAGGLAVWRAIDWTPAEISLVPIGADAGAGVRALGVGVGGQATGPLDAAALARFAERAAAAVGGRSFACSFSNTTTRAATAAARTVPPTSTVSAVDSTPTTEHSMDEQDVLTRGATTQTGANTTTTAAIATPAAQQRTEADIRADEQSRITGIRSAIALARRSTQGITGLDEAFETGLVQRGVSLDQARAAIFDLLASHSTAAGPQRGAAAIQTISDEQEQRRDHLANAMQHRANPGTVKLADGARRYRGHTLAELARRSLDEQGVRTEGMTRNQIVSMAMGNSDDMGVRAMLGVPDFSIALANTVGRTLRNAYESAGRTFQRWARQGTLTDFRPATRVAVAGNLSLQKVNEFGEFKAGKIVDAGETIQLATYGKTIAVSRQAIINDDLDFLSRLPAMFGRAAADFESDTVYAVLKANAAMADGTALFHANHGNLSATGTVIGEAGLSEARKALRLQTDPSGNGQPLNLIGRFLIVGATKETEAQKQLMVIVANQSANANVFMASYEIVVEPRLDASNPNEWFLAADPAQIDTVEYAYLEGEDGLYTEQRMGFEVDGIEVKARLDFAAKATDWRGIFKNTGA